MATLDESELRALVEEVLRALTARLSPAAAPRHPLVILMDGARAGDLHAFDLLRALASREPLMIPSPIGIERHREEPLALAIGCPKRIRRNLMIQEAERLIEDAPAVLLLQPTRATLARAARGLDDTGIPALLLHALARGKRTVAAGGDLLPDALPASAPVPMKHGAGSLTEQLSVDVERLASWGLQVRAHPLEAKALLDAPATPKVAIPADAAPKKEQAMGKRQFITSEDVRAIHRSGKRELTLPENAVVTDEARTVAAELNVTLMQG